MSAVFYAVIAAVAASFYSYFQRLASPGVNQLFGALVVSAAALTIAALLLVLQLGKIRLFTNPVSIWFLLGAGAAAFSIEYFSLQAYSRGLPISVGAPIGIAGGVATAVVIGLLLGEQLSLAKLAGLVLVVSGGIIFCKTNDGRGTRFCSSVIFGNAAEDCGGEEGGKEDCGQSCLKLLIATCGKSRSEDRGFSFYNGRSRA